MRFEVAQHLNGECGLEVDREVVLTVDGLGDQVGFGEDDVGETLTLLVEAQHLSRQPISVHDLEIDLGCLVREEPPIDPGPVHPG